MAVSVLMRIVEFVQRFSSQHTVQVLLCVLLVGGRVLGAVLVVVVLEDGHHVVVSKVNRFVHRCVSPPASEGKAQWCLPGRANSSLQQQKCYFHVTCLWELGWLYRLPEGNEPPQHVLKHTNTPHNQFCNDALTHFTHFRDSEAWTEHLDQPKIGNSIEYLPVFYYSVCFYLQQQPRAGPSLSRSPSAPCPWMTMQTWIAFISVLLNSQKQRCCFVHSNTRNWTLDIIVNI